MLLGHNAAVLASVSRAVALSRGPDEPVEQKGDIGAALSDVFRRLTRHGPSLMVLEDLEAADEHSLDLLYQLATGQREVPLLLVCTCRTEEVVPDGPVARLFQRLDGPKLASYVEPRALSFVETQLLVAQLLGGQLDQAGLNAIYLLAKGNPYYTEEAVRALRGRGQLSESNGIWYVPGGVSVGWNRDQLRRRPSGSGDFRLAAHFRIRS
jgi:predicted ATPase